MSYRKENCFCLNYFTNIQLLDIFMDKNIHKHNKLKDKNIYFYVLK